MSWSNTSFEHIFAISHLQDSAAIDGSFQQASSVQSKYEAIVLRRITLDHIVSSSLNQLLTSKSRQPQQSLWKKLEFRNVQGDIKNAICMILPLDMLAEFQFVCNAIDLTTEAWLALSAGLQICRRLKCFRYSGSLFEHGMVPLIQALKDPNLALEVLDFSWSNVEEEEALTKLAEGLTDNVSLKDLRFMGCSLTDQMVATLLNALASHPNVKALDFNGNKAGPLASHALAAMLHGNTCIENLDISFQSSEEPLLIHPIADALLVNTTLKRINISNCGITDADTQLLCHALCESSSLEELLLARNKMTDEGMAHFGSRLPSMRGLKRVSLWGNPFEDRGAKALARGLEHNFIIEDVDLFRNFPCSDEISLYTALNRGGRKFLHESDDNSPLGLWPLLLERLERLALPKGCKATNDDLVYYMLHGPALLHDRG
jgi:Ran GTPase-activating protein (RanGAP) involved in mRNA processing and transport